MAEAATIQPFDVCNVRRMNDPDDVGCSSRTVLMSISRSSFFLPIDPRYHLIFFVAASAISSAIASGSMPHTNAIPLTLVISPLSVTLKGLRTSIAFVLTRTSPPPFGNRPRFFRTAFASTPQCARRNGKRTLVEYSKRGALIALVPPFSVTLVSFPWKRATGSMLCISKQTLPAVFVSAVYSSLHSSFSSLISSLGLNSISRDCTLSPLRVPFASSDTSWIPIRC
mmetsp:Transcript_374/g.386  ORF Transcript_374/g.386 Transcript_374/m.386 type:complete len:226 (+) Transcript_374:608-1285(+)